MSAFLRLFRIQLKRFFSAARGLFIFSIIFFAVLAFIASVFTKNMSFSGTRERLKIGIVGDVSIPYFDAGLNTLKYLDSSNQIVEIITMPLEQAVDLMNRGKLSAYIVIPEGFIESVENGSNDMQVTYVTSAGAQGIESIFKEHIADIVSTLLINAQAGIFAIDNLAYRHGQRSHLNEYNYQMNMNYIRWTLDRKNFLRVEEQPLSKGVGIYGYYLCAVICSFLVFFGIGSLWLFTGNKDDRHKFLYSKGNSAFVQIACESLSYYVLMLCCLLIVFVIILIFAGSGKLTLPEWRFCGAFAGSIKLFFAAVMVCLMLGSLQVMLFEAVNQIVPSVLLQFLTGFVLSFIGGCFYPLDFFPTVVQNVGKILPVGQGLSLLANSVSGEFSIIPFVICIAYFFVFELITVFLRTLRIKGESVL